MGIPGQNALLKVLEEPPKYGVFLLLTDNPEKLLPTVRSRCTELALQALPEPVLKSTLSQEFPEASPEDLSSAISRSGGYLGQAKEILSQDRALPPQTLDFVRGFAARDAAHLARVLAPMEKWKREPLLQILRSWLDLMEENLAARAMGRPASALARQIGEGRSAQELMEAIRHLQKVLEYAQGNVSPAAVCGYLLWVLR